MKTENTLENKAKFFAQHYNQRVLRNKVSNNKGLCFPELAKLHDYFLELTPLSQITDEDAIDSLKLIISSRDSSAFDYCKSQNYSIEQMVNYFNRHLVYDFKLILTDYLRSKGYALPWMDLSIEDLVDYGWVKLKSE